MILVDTGPLVAAALHGDIDHIRCVELFTSLHLNQEALLVPSYGTKLHHLVENRPDEQLPAAFAAPEACDQDIW